MKVINRNIGTPMLSHYCPSCGQEVFNDSSVRFDTDRNCGIKKCDNCGVELEFPNTAGSFNAVIGCLIDRKFVLRSFLKGEVMKSLDYIKQRISDGTTGLTDCNYESMTEVNTVDIYEKIYDTRKLEHGLTLKSIIDERKYAEVYYDPNADFNYFSMSRNNNDGTLMFDLEAMKYVLTKVLACQTYNKAVVSEPVDMDFFNTHYFKYTVGDIVLCQEYSEEFSTKEKPWMTRRSTALLPIKFEVFEK